LLCEWRDPNGLLRQLNMAPPFWSLLSRRAYLSRVLHYSRLRVQLLHELPVLDASTKAHLARPTRRYSTRIEAYQANIFRLFAIPVFLMGGSISLLVLAELLLLFHPESGELSATFIATAIILLAWRYFALKAPIEFDWRQRMTGLSLIPIALGLAVGASLFGAGVLLESIWQTLHRKHK
jgi:hypothetical protein